MFFHYFISAGSHFNLSLSTFLLIQITLVMIQETYEKYTYNDKIDVRFYIGFIINVCN